MTAHTELLRTPVAPTGSLTTGADVSDGGVEVSVVMPCLDEADTVASCIRTAQRALREAGIAVRL